MTTHRNTATAAACLILAAACSAERVPEEQPASPADTAPAAGTAAATAPADTSYLGFTCDDAFRFTLRAEDGTGTLFLPDTVMVLERTVAATGNRYARAGVELWHDEHTGELTVTDAHYPRCRVSPEPDPWTAARLRGVSFRAVGQEPGWLLDITADSILLSADYGERVVRAAAPPPHRQPGSLAWRAAADGHQLHVAATETRCHDAMSGEPFPWTVTVRLDETRYDGCGRLFR